MKSLPQSWDSDSSQRYNVIFLRHTIDSKKILDDLPVKSDIEQLEYRQGALLWSTLVSDWNRSNVAKLLSRKVLQDTTVRNLNTTKKLYEMMKKSPG